MKIPSSLYIDSIVEPCICHYKDKTFAPDSPPHFNLLIPVENNVSLVICIFTSQVEKRLSFHKDPKTRECLHKVNKNIFKFLSKDTIIDCNSVQHLNKDELIGRIEENTFTKIANPLPKEFLSEVIRKILQSPVVKLEIKGLLRESETINYITD